MIILALKDLVERFCSRRNFVTRLTAIHLFLLSSIGALPALGSEIITIDVSPLNSSSRHFFAFWLTSSLPWDSQAISRNQDNIAIDCGQLTLADCRLISRFVSSDGLADVRAARDAWYESYLDTRDNRGNLEWIPDTFEEFKVRVPYLEWSSKTVDSRVKRSKRVIYQGRVDNRRVSVAESWPAGASEAREYEIIIEAKRQAGTYDFYVYDHTGTLTNTSEFPAGVKPAPTVCVGCHMDRRTGKTTRFITNEK